MKKMWQCKFCSHTERERYNMSFHEQTCQKKTNMIQIGVEENKVLKNALRSMLNKVNKVTAQHRHGFRP